MDKVEPVAAHLAIAKEEPSWACSGISSNDGEVDHSLSFPLGWGELYLVELADGKSSGSSRFGCRSVRSSSMIYVSSSARHPC